MPTNLKHLIHQKEDLMSFALCWSSGRIVLAVLTVLLASLIAVEATSAEEHRYIVGMATTCADRGSWHDDEADEVSALDLVKCGGGTANTAVYYQGYGYSGTVYAYIVDHNGSCPGVDIDLYDNSTFEWLGSVRYVQIDVAGGVVGDDFTAGTTWTFYYVGDVEDSKECDLWDGAHLHQSGENGTGTAIYTNWGIEDPIDPTGSTSSNWMHRASW